MRNNKNRIAHFTSSNAYKLIKKGSRHMTADELMAYKKENPKSSVKTIADGFSAAGLTYISEKKIELRLGKSIEREAYSQDMAWGKFMELVVFNELGSAYVLSSVDTDLHPVYGKFWAGSVDAKDRHGNFIAEIKAYQLKKFCEYTDCLLLGNVDIFREEYPEEYWQIVSNAAIHGVKFGEAITFAPYESDMPFIQDLAANYDGPDQWMFKFIADKPISDLACLPDGGYYKNVNKFRFEIPRADTDYLTSRMEEAGEILLAV